MKIRKTVDDAGRIHYYNEYGQFHRTDGPAVEYRGGYKAWYIHDKRHRTDGPAIEWSDGTKEWYVYGIRLTEEEFQRQITKLYKILYT